VGLNVTRSWAVQAIAAAPFACLARTALLGTFRGSGKLSSIIPGNAPSIMYAKASRKPGFNQAF
jgi:hypothetical protein